MKTKNPQNATNRKNESLSKNTYSNFHPLVKTPIFGVGVTNEASKDILEYIINFLQKTGKNMYIVTPNPEMIMLAQKNESFRNALNEATLALTDGIGLFMGGKLVGIPLKERIIGTDFVERLCGAIADWPITVGFLGGGAGVAESAAECLKARYPGLKVVFAEAEWGQTRGLGSHRQQHIDILFVAFGAPKQELWMAEHIDKVPVRVMMGVGGALDQIVDQSLRPPALVHSLGLGWFYRLIREPWRIKRQAALVPFVWLVLKEKLK